MTSTRRHVSDAERRAVLVDRQLLGSGGRSDRTIDDVLDAIGLLHSTDPVTPYLSLHARTDATVADVEHALYDATEPLLRQTTIRRTVFVMACDIAPLACGAYNSGLVTRLRSQLVKWIDAAGEVDASGEVVIDRAGAAVVETLRAGGPLTGAQLSTRVDDLRITVFPNPTSSPASGIRITSKVLEILVAEGRIARGRPSGKNITSSAWTWVAMDDWWPDGIDVVEPAEALAGLLSRYLGSFGPATVTDIAWWTGLPKGKVSAALNRIGAVEVSLDDGGTGWLGPDDDLLQSTTPVSAVSGSDVALLPGLDSTTMGWKQRSWYVDDTPAGGFFDRTGNAGPTIWFDGSVVGVWTHGTSEVITDVIVDVGQEIHGAIATEAARIEHWLGDVRVKWRFPTPCTKALSLQPELLRGREQV